MIAGGEAAEASSSTSLHQAALACLLAESPDDKVRLTAATFEAALPLRDDQPRTAPPLVAARPSRPRLVSPRQLAQRGLGSAEGRAAFIHAIAHIEFNAINLAWDAVCRFPDMPEAFHRDWSSVAADEARHFGLLQARLAATGHAYGDFDAHDGLWQMALVTRHSCTERMALVPRVLEARGLDVTPAMIVRLRQVGDHETADVLALILREEVRHVAVGSRWFEWCCARDRVDPQATFERLIRTHAGGAVRAPFNITQRREAGFSDAELLLLQRVSDAGR